MAEREDDEFVDMYENEPGHWEHRPPPAFPDPRPFEPVRPQWAREMNENAGGCLSMLIFAPLIAGLLTLLSALF